MDPALTAPPDQPDWMKGFKPAPVRRGNPAWTPGCESPNKSGRPKGIKDRRTRVAEALADDAPAIARVVIDAALEGDLQACALVLARVAPTLRSQSQTVSFAFDPTGSISAQMEQVLVGIASGEVPPDVGRTILDAVSALSAIRTVEELEQRIIELEARA